MVDESRDLEPDTDDETEPESESQDRHQLRRALTVIAVIIIVVLILLLARGCFRSDTNGSSSGGGKEIVPVGGLPPQPGAVSVWVDEGTSIDTVLSAAGILGSDVVNMDGGRFIVTVPTGTELKVARRLAQVDGVADAGLVYRSGKAK